MISLHDLPPWTAAACCRFPAASLLARRGSGDVRRTIEADPTADPTA